MESFAEFRSWDKMLLLFSVKQLSNGCFLADVVWWIIYNILEYFRIILVYMQNHKKNFETYEQYRAYECEFFVCWLKDFGRSKKYIFMIIIFVLSVCVCVCIFK